MGLVDFGCNGWSLWILLICVMSFSGFLCFWVFVLFCLVDGIVEF